ncbi:MAG: DegT/DnrJ/EryC1/StrS family aminotransferase [Candidatus Hydrothermarchaeota archaeon]|nr:DegT/DnrJ/EryC1/StrS family aminotransferase [Candidatus Hydrothermarchaeota archaeon]
MQIFRRFYMTIPLVKQNFTKEMKEAAIYALENERFVLGESVFKFEEKFARYCSTKHALAVSSGTAALHLSLIAFELKKNEKVVTTPMSFTATANAVVHAGGVPVFADIEEDTGNIDAGKIITNGVRGIMPVHLYGQPCEMEEIIELKEKGVFIVEDACQAHGAEYKGKKVGSIGHAGCFSFYPSKNMTVGGDGGMVTTDDEKIAEEIRKLRDCGRKGKYEHDSIGFTYRLNTVNAAIGLVQLKYLDAWNEKRRKIAKLYRKLLPEEILLSEKKHVKHVYHVFVVKVKEREKLIEHLKSNGIEIGIHYPIPIHLQPIYRQLFGYKEGSFPIAEKFSKEVLSLPIYPQLSADEVKFVCEKIEEFLQ